MQSCQHIFIFTMRYVIRMTFEIYLLRRFFQNMNDVKENWAH